MSYQFLRVAMTGALLVLATTAAWAQSPAAQVASPASSSMPLRARENYRIGPYDVLELRVLGEPEMSASAINVSADGFIQVPFVDDDIRAQCLTERELSAVIAEKLKKLLKYPEVSIGVKEYNSIPVAIIGAVGQPGRFRMERRVSLLELVTFAGGINKDSGKLLTLVRQPAETQCQGSAVVEVGDSAEMVTEFIAVKSLLAGEPDQNRIMRPGDIVVVPIADLIYVAGDVVRPNSFPLRDGMTFTQALAQAGGPLPTAKKGSIRIVRQTPGQPREILAVDLDAINKNQIVDPVMMANDVIEVPNSAGKTFFRNFFGALGGSVGGLPIGVIP